MKNNIYYLIISIFIYSSIYAQNTLYFEDILDRNNTVYEINMEKEIINTVPQIENFKERSNIVNRNFIFIKFDKIKKSNVFYNYNLNNNTKRFLFMFSEPYKITDILVNNNEQNIIFATANFIDRPNTIRIYNYSISLNKIFYIFQIDNKDTFYNIEHMSWLNNNLLLLKIYSEDKKTKILFKTVDINSAKKTDLTEIETNSLKAFSVSSDSEFIAYHLNNGSEKSIELPSIEILNLKEKKVLPLIKKAPKKKPETIIKQVFWSDNSKNLLFLEAKGKYDPELKDFKLKSNYSLKSIIINKKETIETIFNSPTNYNIIEIFAKHKKGYIAQIHNKENDEYQLVLINNSGAISKVLMKKRVAQLF